MSATADDEYGPYMDSICTCKGCSHQLTRSYIEVACSCCDGASHSAVLDGIEGFAPEIKLRSKVDNSADESIRKGNGSISSSNISAGNDEKQQVDIPLDKNIVLYGSLKVFDDDNIPKIVLFAHGSGSGRHSPRNRYVANVLNEERIGTLLFDLLTNEEEVIDAQTREYRFDIGLLAKRLVGVTDWLLQNQKKNQKKNITNLKIGYFGASTGAAAALVAAAERASIVRAVVSRGGRPDLAEESLGKVTSPTLLLVGQNDVQVIELNRAALDRLQLLDSAKKSLEIIPGASHLFEEPGKLEQVASLAADWFKRFLDHDVKENQRPFPHSGAEEEGKEKRWKEKEAT